MSETPVLPMKERIKYVAYASLAVGAMFFFFWLLVEIGK